MSYLGKKLMNPKQRLERFIQSGNIPHALLFAGPQGAGKSATAIQFAVDLLQTSKKPENHPDIHTYFPEGKAGMHPIESIRMLAQEASLAPYEGQWKIFIIHESEKMLPTSSNALLKILEEPAKQTLIILISHHPANLLATVRSRCQTLEFPPQSKPHIDTAILALLADAKPRHFSTFESEKPEAVFETILFWYRDRLLLEIGNCEEHLHFPEHLDSLRNTPLIPLEFVEKQISLARLAHARSTKLSTCLEMLFLSLELF